MAVGRRDMTCPQPGQVALYRFYDDSEELLYVGFSNEPWRRRKQHSVTQPWYPRVKHQAITWYDSEADARRAEKIAIRQERPHFNIAGAIRPPAPARARLHLGLRPWVWVNRAVFSFLLAGAAVFARSGLPKLAPVLVAVEYAFLLSCLLFTCGACVLGAAPALRRLGAWIEQNTSRTQRPDFRAVK